MLENDGDSRLKKVFARDIMTEDVAVIKGDVLIGHVAHRMLRERVSGYPIVDDQGNVIGIITYTDFFLLMDKMNAESKQGDNLGFPQNMSAFRDRPISEVMSHTVISIKPETSLEDVIKMVIKERVHTFPVIEEKKLVGIIGRHDILNAAFVYG